MITFKDTETEAVEVEDLVERDGWFLNGTAVVETALVRDTIDGFFGPRVEVTKEVYSVKVTRCVWVDGEGNERPAPDMHQQIGTAAERFALGR